MRGREVEHVAPLHGSEGDFAALNWLVGREGEEVEEIMAAISLSDKVLKFISELEIEGDINRKLEHLIEKELIRRLARYQLTNRLLKEKYGMSFDEFKKNRIVKKQNYSFEVESDFWNWEMALDGIETIKRKLKVLKESQDEHQ